MFQEYHSWVHDNKFVSSGLYYNNLNQTSLVDLFIYLFIIVVVIHID